jgi:hypothetical protein
LLGQAPNEYLPRWKCANARLELGKYRAAIDDLNHVLHLKPDFNEVN